jgi:forkhead box protein K
MGTASPQVTDASQLPAITGDPPFPDKISAYYSLVFPNFTYYLQTLTVTIGRRCIPTNNSASSSATNVTQVDVDLGPLKSVSRLHAKIEYEEEEERFVLIVIGRNGAWVDGVWSGSGSKVALSERFALHSSPYH